MTEELAYINTCCLRNESVLTLSMFFDYERGCSQGLEYVMDTWDEEKQERVGTAQGCQILMDLLNAFQVSNLDEIVGQHCIVIKDDLIRDIRSLRVKGGKTVKFFRPRGEHRHSGKGWMDDC